jgi:hypothetical protein
MNVDTDKVLKSNLGPVNLILFDNIIRDPIKRHPLEYLSFFNTFTST